MIKTISYLGLGTMGSGMAANLLKAGYKLTVWNRNAEKCEPFARKSARVADTPADAVRDVDLVVYSLSNDQAVEEIVFGSKGILSGIKEGQIAMDMSTVLPATSLREQEAYAKRGVDFLDAPVFGSKSGESARQQRLLLVLPYVLLWSNRAVIHLDRDDSWINPPSARAQRRTRKKPFAETAAAKLGAPLMIILLLLRREHKRQNAGRSMKFCRETDRKSRITKRTRSIRAGLSS